MSDLRVRRATPNDAEGIARVHVKSWQAAYKGLVPRSMLGALSVEQWSNRWRILLGGRDEKHFALVAEREGEVIGFCAVTLPSREPGTSPGTAEITSLYAAPEVWKEGVGATLLHATMEVLRKACWQEVTLWVFAGNNRARQFYAQFGFQPDGAENRNPDSGLDEIRVTARLG